MAVGITDEFDKQPHLILMPYIQVGWDYFVDANEELRRRCKTILAYNSGWPSLILSLTHLGYEEK